MNILELSNNFFRKIMPCFSLLLCVTILIVEFSNCDGKPTKSSLDSNYEEEITYPFQQYIQVRKSYSVEHLPAYEEDSGSQSTNSKSKSNNLESSASSPSANHEGRHSDSDRKDHYDQEEDDIESTSHYIKPRLREEITDYKKQEVYEEKGHADGEYDHKAYHGKDQHQDRDYPENNDYEHEQCDSNHHHHRRHRHYPKYRNKKYDNHKYNNRHRQNDYNNPEASSTNTRNNYNRNRLYTSLHEPDGTSTKVLEYAARNLYDKDAHEKGIYAARDDIYCPEVIDFDLSSKKMAMGQGGNNPRGAKPRLKGLGSKITCLKNKYFGKEPLPKAIFLDPSESRHSVIEIPSFDQFYKNIRQHVGSMSSFQD